MLKLLPVLLIWLGMVSPLAGETGAPPPPRDITADMSLIPGGAFPMGCDKFGPKHGAPAHTVYLDDFMIDKYEVTNKRFEEIIPDHKLRRSQFSACDNCPVTRLTWYDATDYCYLIGKTLPTEAQWEKATGAPDGCSFPWGDRFDPVHPQAHAGLKLRDKAAPVGNYPPNKYGIYDLVGNVWEWMANWFSPTANSRDEIKSNPRGPLKGQVKVRRGGSWSDNIVAMNAGYRDWSYPFSRSLNDVGFRCAINLKSNGKPNQN